MSTRLFILWIDPIQSELNKGALDPSYWQALQLTPEWYSWQGYAFESACHKHVINIKRALKLNPTSLSGSWRFVPKQGSIQRGAQIDLLFDRRDDAITVCEIKFTDKPFTITKDYAEALSQKVAVFKVRTGTTKQVFTVIVSANGITKNKYSEELISSIVTLDDLFKQLD